jgi:hypothetical protein
VKEEFIVLLQAVLTKDQRWRQEIWRSITLLASANLITLSLLGPNRETGSQFTPITRGNDISFDQHFCFWGNTSPNSACGEHGFAGA